MTHKGLKKGSENCPEEVQNLPKMEINQYSLPCGAGKSVSFRQKDYVVVGHTQI